MKLIIGLGNPGNEYYNTRHNIGFLIVDSLAESLGVSFTFDKAFEADMASYGQGDARILLAKPQTFMNNSGQAVQAILNFYKMAPADLWVVHDDIDLEFGQAKPTADSGSAGHNGIESIIHHLKTRQFSRLRVGVANDLLRQFRALPDTGERKLKVGDFVTSDFSADERARLPEIIGTQVSFLRSQLSL